MTPGSKISLKFWELIFVAYFQFHDSVHFNVADHQDYFSIFSSFFFLSREFCGMVRKILILTREEVQRMNPGTFNSKGEETSSVAEGLDAKEVKNVPPTTSSSSPDDC